jgi:outer membrane lipoprotein-sorting protein
MRLVSLFIRGALAGVLMAPLAFVANAEEPLSPKQIIESMAKTYAGCKSYSDTGTVKASFSGSSGNFTIERNFTTAFARPDRFRFDCRERNTSSGNKESRYIVWGKGREAQLWKDSPPGAKKMDSLSTALAQTSGASGGSANTIPALLLPDRVGGFRLTNLSDLKRIDDAACNGSICFRLLGRFSAESSMTIWIDNRTFLLRRIDSMRKSAQFTREQTTAFEPVLDGQISDQALELNAP